MSTTVRGRTPKAKKLHCRISGEEIMADVEPRLLLSDFLRHELRLTGTNIGCEMSARSACTVIVDGRAVRSCLMFAVQAALRTVECLAQGAIHARHALQRSFRQHLSLQGIPEHRRSRVGDDGNEHFAEYLALARINARFS